MASEIAERIRGAVNRKTGMVGIALGIAIVLALFYAAYSMGYFSRRAAPDLASMKAYFMDEETGQIEVHLASEIPPLAGKSGKPTVVHACFFTTSNDDARKLVYLERFTPEGKAAKEATRNGRPPTSEEMQALHHGTQVRSPELNSPWVFADSPEGRAVLNGIFALDPDANKVRPVLPK